MTLTDRAVLVLQQIDAALEMAEKATPGPWEKGKTCVGIPAVMESCQSVALMGIRRYSVGDSDLPNHEANSAFIAASRTLLPTSLRCLKTAIEGLIAATEWNERPDEEFMPKNASTALTTLCDQWQASR